MPFLPLQLREHYLSGPGWAEFGSTNDVSAYIGARDYSIEIMMFVVFPKSFLHGKRLRYTRTLGGYSGSAQKWIYGEIIDGSYDRASNTDFPSGAWRISKGAGRLLLIEESYAGGTTSTKTTGTIDLSASTQDYVTVCWLCRAQDSGRSWYLTLTDFDLLNADGSQITTLDFNAYVAEGTTSGQRYGTMGRINPYGVLVAPLVQPWQLRSAEYTLTSPVVQGWELLDRAAGVLVESWGLKMGADLKQSWGDATVLTLDLTQPWGDAAILASPLEQRWRDSFTLAAELQQEWAISGSLLLALDQPWSLTGAPVQSALVQPWALRDVTPLLAELRQTWALVPDASDVAVGGGGSTGGEGGGDGSTGGSVLRYTVAVTVGGEVITPSHVNIEASLDQDVLTCEIHPATEADYLACTEGAPLAVAVTVPSGAVESYTFVVTAARIDEQWGSTRYIVEAMSPAVLLGEPYAAGIEGELTGRASTLAASLAGAVPLTWQTVDWAITPGVWIASGETPLTLLKQLAGAVGAVLQSQPDGSLRVLPAYPIPVPSWQSATAAATLVDVLDCTTTGATPEHRPGYNRYLIGEQATSADSLTIEEETLSATVKLIRVYQVPWADDFELAHTGGAWVTIEPQGIESRQETETVEFIGGSAKVRYPLHGLVAVAWLQANLGTVTTAEDGGLTATVAAESLTEITYTTRCRLYRVTDNQDEQLQLVAYL